MSGSPLQPCRPTAFQRRPARLARLLAQVLALVLMGGLTVASGPRAAQAAPAPGAPLPAIAAWLESGTDGPREEPFVIRPFEPVLEGRWIGHAVAYGWYRRGQAPGGPSPREAELLEDLRILAGHWNLLRVYNADDDTRRVLELIRAHGLPLRVLLGVWLEGEDGRPASARANRANLLRGIELTRAFPELVLAVSVGNETQVDWSAHRLPPELLIRYLRVLRAQVAVPVTTADDYNFWNKPASQVVAGELDFLTTHAHPLWNGQTPAGSLEWLDRTLATVRALHPGRPLVLGETGWATEHNPERLGPGEQGTLMRGGASLAAQGEFLRGLHDWVERTRVPTFWFEAFDEPWKGGGEQADPRDVEKHWGVFHEDRTPKPSFRAYLQAEAGSGAGPGAEAQTD
ncbi:MAG: glycosyl hydrolase family 17 [Candidatus Delongbacteria bacterium]